jgi:hypothetical protein
VKRGKVLPFERYSCLLFLMDVGDQRIPDRMIRFLLCRHAQACDCDCAACEEFRKRHELMELEALR